MRGKRLSATACSVSVNAPEMSDCDAMTVAAVASATIGSSAHPRRQRVERIVESLRIGNDDCALSDIVEDQRRQDEHVPRNRDRNAPEVRHVGVERLGARHAENHRAENQKAEDAVMRDEPDAVQRIDRTENRRMLHDRKQSPRYRSRQTSRS